MIELGAGFYEARKQSIEDEANACLVGVAFKGLSALMLWNQKWFPASRAKSAFGYKS